MEDFSGAIAPGGPQPGAPEQENIEAPRVDIGTGTTMGNDLVETSSYKASPEYRIKQLEAYLASPDEEVERKPAIDIKKYVDGDAEQTSFVDKSVDAIKSMGSFLVTPFVGETAAAMGYPEIKQRGEAVSVGALQYAENMGNGVINSVDATWSWLQSKGLKDQNAFPNLSFVESMKPAGGYQTDVEKNAYNVGKFTASMAAFVGGGQLAALRGAGAALQFGSGVAASAAINFMGFDPKEDQLGSLAKEIPVLRDMLPEFLNAHEDDSEMELRFKQALNGAVDDTLLAGAFLGVGKLYRKGRAVRAAMEETRLAKLKKPLEEVPTQVDDIQKTHQGGEPNAINASGEPIGAVAAQADDAQRALQSADPNQTSLFPETPKTPVLDADGNPLKAPPAPKAPSKSVGEVDLSKTPLELTPEQDKYFKKTFGNTVMGSFGDSPEAQAFWRKWMVDNWDELIKARGGVKTGEMAKQVRLGLGFEKILDPRSGLALNTEQLDDLGAFLQVQTNRLLKAKSPTEFMRVKTEISEVAGPYIAKGNAESISPYRIKFDAEVADAARKLNIAKKYKNQNKLAQIMEDKIKMAASDEEAVEIMQHIQQVIDKDPKNAVAILTGAEKLAKEGSWSDAAFGTWYSGMLYNPTTWKKNMFGNTTALIANVGERYIAALDPKSTTTILEANLKASSAATSFIDGFAVVLQKFKLDKVLGGDIAERAGNFRTARDKFKAATGFSKTSSKFVKSDSFKKLQNMGKLGNGAAAVLAFPFEVLGKTDEAFKVVAYSSEIRSQAFRQATSEGLSVGSKEFIERMGNIEDAVASGKFADVDPVTKFNEAIATAAERGMEGAVAEAYANDFVKKATAESEMYRGIYKTSVRTAKEVTFTQNPKGAYEAILNLVESMGPVGKLVVPFGKIAVNMADYTLQRVPLLANYTDDYQKAKKAGGQAWELAQAKVRLGGSLVAIGAVGSYAGAINGSEPEDKATRNAMIASGVRFNSIQIGGTYFPLDNLGAIGSILKLGADTREMFGYLNDEEQDIVAVMGSFLAAKLVDLTTPDFLTEGVFEVLDAMKTQKANKGRALVAGITKSMMPFGGAARFVTKDVAPAFGFSSTKKDTRGDSGFKEWEDVYQATIREWRSNIPGLGEGLPAQQNLFGEDIHHPSMFGPRVVSPIAFSKNAKANKVAFQEIARLGLASSFMREDLPEGETALRIDSPERTVSVKGINVTLNPVQYARFSKLSAGIGLGRVKDPEGVDPRIGTLRDSLTSLISSDYRNPTGAGRLGRIPGDGRYHTDESKRIAIRNVVAKYREKAKQQLFREFPELRQETKERFLERKGARNTAFKAKLNGLGR